MYSSSIYYYKWETKKYKELFNSFKEFIDIKSLQFYMPVYSLYFYIHNKSNANKKIDRNLTCYVYCAGGYRSVIACSILRRDRFKELVNIESGFSGISKLI